MSKNQYRLFVDFEANQIHNSKEKTNLNKLLQISAIKVDITTNKVVNEFNYYIKTDDNIHPKILLLLNKKPIFFKNQKFNEYEVITKFINFINDVNPDEIYCFGNFDQPLFNSCYQRLFKTESSLKFIDFVPIIKQKLNWTHKWNSCLYCYQKAFNLSHNNIDSSHDGLKDAYALFQIYNYLNQFDNNQLLQLKKQIYETSIIPSVNYIPELRFNSYKYPLINTKSTDYNIVFIDEFKTKMNQNKQKEKPTYNLSISIMIFDNKKKLIDELKFKEYNLETRKYKCLYEIIMNKIIKYSLNSVIILDCYKKLVHDIIKYNYGNAIIFWYISFNKYRDYLKALDINVSNNEKDKYYHLIDFIKDKEWIK